LLVKKKKKKKKRRRRKETLADRLFFYPQKHGEA